MIDEDWKFFFIMINNHIVTLRQDIKSKCSDFSSVSKMLPLSSVKEEDPAVDSVELFG
jgi:hypothetical protein